MANISQLPLSKVPFLDGNSGLVSREWYRFLNNMFGLTGGGGSDLSLSDVQVGPATVYTDQTAELQKQIDGLGAAPTYAPHASMSRYGAFYDTATQTAAVINTAYGITFNSTTASWGVTVGSPTSRLYVDRPGFYQIDAFVRFNKTGGAGATATVWFRKNGADLAATGVTVYVTTTNPVTSQTLPYVLQLAAGDYVEVLWATTDTTIQAFPVAAAAPYPAIPSARVRITNLTG